ncbi:MAG: rhodanese-like domain-containing protein [Aquabacterium sp.]|nr:MAG: rhodanese-like domain-containing protein [Aquabacterium sp.]
MSFFVQNWYLFVIAAVSGGMLLWPAISGGSGITVAEAVQLINREKGIVIDVSDAQEYAQGHVAGARNLPLASLQEAQAKEGGKDAGKKGGKGLPTNKALPLILVDATGARAGKAAALLKTQGYEKAVALAGGLKAWREADMPVEKAADQGSV